MELEVATLPSSLQSFLRAFGERHSAEEMYIYG
jgi:hypothetical protein